MGPASSIRTLQLSTISIKMKTALVLIFTFALLSQGYALKCHVCTGTAGICETGKDPEEKTCASSEKSCLFMSSGTGDSKVEYKACSAIDKAICQDMTLGTTTAKACMCTDDNCNKDSTSCKCSGASAITFSIFTLFGVLLMKGL